jgi:acylphosphatase
VGFRHTAQSIARRFPITGYVRNLADGRVELVAEGPADILDRYQTAVRDAMAGNIASVEAEQGLPTGEFASFSIAR